MRNAYGETYALNTACVNDTPGDRDAGVGVCRGSVAVVIGEEQYAPEADRTVSLVAHLTTALSMVVIIDAWHVTVDK